MIACTNLCMNMVATLLLKLAQKNKIVILPHMGSATIEGRIDMGEKVIINIRTLFDGHRPPDRVLPRNV